MILTKETRPGTAATVQDAQIHNEHHHDIPPKVSCQAPDTEKIIRLLRDHEVSTGQKWPGDWVEHPMTLYPNLAAEILAARYYLLTPADHAMVTEGLLADVLEKGKELHILEVARLANLLGCRASYLLAPVLQIVDPTTNKGRAKRKALLNCMEDFWIDFGPSGVLAGYFHQRQVGYAETITSRLLDGQPVTYAGYRRSLINLQDMRYFLSARYKRGR